MHWALAVSHVPSHQPPEQRRSRRCSLRRPLRWAASACRPRSWPCRWLLVGLRWWRPRLGEHPRAPVRDSLTGCYLHANPWQICKHRCPATRRHAPPAAGSAVPVSARPCSAGPPAKCSGRVVRVRARVRAQVPAAGRAAGHPGHAEAGPVAGGACGGRAGRALAAAGRRGAERHAGRAAVAEERRIHSGLHRVHDCGARAVPPLHPSLLAHALPAGQAGGCRAGLRATGSLRSTRPRRRIRWGA